MNAFLILLLQILGSNAMAPHTAPDSGKDILSQDFQVHSESCIEDDSLKLKKTECALQISDKMLSSAKGA